MCSTQHTTAAPGPRQKADGVIRPLFFFWPALELSSDSLAEAADSSSAPYSRGSSPR